jgi:chromosome segregation ATPase
MKRAIVLLAVLSGALVLISVRMYYRDKAMFTHLGSELNSFSNRVAELEMKLNHQERLAGVWKGNYSDCTNTLNQRMNELARLQAALSQAKVEQQTAHERLQAMVAEQQQCEGRVRELQTQARELESLREQAEQNAQSLRQQLESMSVQHNELVLAFAQARTELEQLRASLTNVSLLKARLAGLTTNRPSRLGRRRAMLFRMIRP